jgi:hypothetical protein
MTLLNVGLFLNAFGKVQGTTLGEEGGGGGGGGGGGRNKE